MGKSYFSKISGVSVAIAGLFALGACNSLTECQRYFPVASEALQCQRGADEIAPLVKARYAGRGRIEYDRAVSMSAEGCEQVRMAGGTVRCI